MISIQHIVETLVGVHAVDDCTFDVREGTLTGLIGPSGSGKNVLRFRVEAFVIGSKVMGLGSALVIRDVWTLTESFTGMLPDEFVTRASAFRIFLIGLLLEIILLTRPHGMLPEQPPEPFERR